MVRILEAMSCLKKGTGKLHAGMTEIGSGFGELSRTPPTKIPRSEIFWACGLSLHEWLFTFKLLNSVHCDALTLQRKESQYVTNQEPHAILWSLKCKLLNSTLL